VTLSTKTVRGWGCDCPEYPHPSAECALRYPVVVELPTDPEWRAGRRAARVSRETNRPPEIIARPLLPSDPGTRTREIARLAQVAESAKYARGYPPGEVTMRGECGICHKDVLVKLDGGLRTHTSLPKVTCSGTDPAHGTIWPDPVDSIAMHGSDWAVIYEGDKYRAGWVKENEQWRRADASTVKERAFR
jgi:hypothetical protein